MVWARVITDHGAIDSKFLLVVMHDGTPGNLYGVK